MKQYLLAPQARRDIVDIGEYIARDNPEAADRMVARFDDAFEFLSRHTRTGQSRDDLVSGMKLFPVGRYVIAFRPTTGECTVEILRVVHGARDLKRLF
jgi:toxin ParE1/3/4